MDDEDLILEEDWPADHRSGVVAVIGRPNVGKSTLINAILGQKIAITTPRPQTTRRQQLGIYTVPEGQILFNDTPGLHRARNKLGEYMMQHARLALKDADVNLWILDASEPPQTPDHYIAETLREAAANTPLVLVLNKIDLVQGKHDFSEHLNLIEHTHVFEVSAITGEGIAPMVEHLLQIMPIGPRYYPAAQVSDQNMRFIAAEIIREKVILNTQEEIPYSIAVDIEEYREQEERTVISATIYVERSSQKGIIIGKGGQMIKTIGTQARHELMEMLEVPVHLDLHVKVLKNWRRDENLMKRIGYRMPREED